MKAGAVLMILLSLVSGALSLLSPAGLLISFTVLIFTIACFSNRDTVSLGATVLITDAVGMILCGGLVRMVWILGLIPAICLTVGMNRYKKRTYPSVFLTDRQIAEERAAIAEKKLKEEQEQARAEAEAKADREAAPLEEEVPAMEEAPTMEKAPAEEEPAAEGSEDLEPSLDEDADAEEDAPVPGLTEMFSSEDTEVLTEDEWNERKELWEESPAEEPELTRVDTELLHVCNNTKEWFESPRKPAPSFPAPQVIVLRKGADGTKEPERITLQSIFRRDEDSFMPDEPFFIESEEGFGWGKEVRIIRYTIRNRTGRGWKYLNYRIICHDILKETVEVEDVDIRAERKIGPGETFIIDVSSRKYGETRGVKAELRAAVDERGEVFRYTHDDTKLRTLPEKMEVSTWLGDDGEEFLKDYAEEYDLGFVPRYAYLLNGQGSACTCPCCGEAMLYDDRNCQLCGAPRERFVYASHQFLKRCYDKWTVKKAERLEAEAREKAAREEAEKRFLARENARKKKEENRRNNIKMWSATLIVAVFIFLAWLYYNI